jgi:glycosyltransferase involved in cell wall biosynthesis
VLQAVSGLGAERFTSVLPCGEEEALSEPAPAWEDTAPVLLYVGTLSWEANIDGLCWMLEQCWPVLKAAHPDLEFRIIGSKPDGRLRAASAAQEGVFLEGFVEDLGPYYRRARVFAAPLRFGSGVKLKVLNTLYRGVPVVTTPVGAEGIPLESGQELYAADSAAEFVQACSRLLEDRAAWERMRDASRVFAAEHLRNSVQLERIREAVLRAAGLASPPSPPLARGGT